MHYQNLKYLKKLNHYKQFSLPLIYLLDKLRLFPIFVPFINFIMKTLGIKKRFQSDLNYRIIGNRSKGIFKNMKKTKNLIIVPFLTSGNNLFLLINFLISYKLSKRNYYPIFLVCDKILPICNNERVFKTRKENKLLCSSCYGTYPFIAKKTGAEFVSLSNFLKKDNLKEIEEINKINNLDDCLLYTYQNYNLGKIAKKSVLRFFLTSKLSNTNEHVEIYKKFLKSLVLFVNGWENLIKYLDIKPKLLLIYNGTLSFESYLREYCYNESINYITHETYVGQNSWIYKKNDEVMKLNWDEQWSAFLKENFTNKQKDLANDFILGLRDGKEMYAKLNEKNIIEKKLREAEYVVLFTNLNFDTSVLDRNPLFDSMLDWIISVIEFWTINNIEKTLVIRIHPGELKLVTASKDFVGEKVYEKVKDNKNIILYDANEKVDSYSLIERMNFGLVYSSTIGLEIAYMNKPCLIAGDPFYKSQPFVTAVKSKSSYFETLNEFLNKDYKLNIIRDDVLRFVYFIYFKRTKRLTGIRMDHSNHVNEFTFDNFFELYELNYSVLEEFEKEIL